jgi:hypothetical protein
MYVTDYNMTLRYGGARDPGNRIIAADSAKAGAQATFGGMMTPTSIHDAKDRFLDGPGMLYQDGHVKVEEDLAPQGSILYEYNGGKYTSATQTTIYGMVTTAPYSTTAPGSQYVGKATYAPPTFANLMAKRGLTTIRPVGSGIIE